jgi:predicted MFS family arabinose efflux permease
MSKGIEVPTDSPCSGAATPAQHGRLRTQMAVLFPTRTVLNVSNRIIYPFLPSIARGLGVSVTAASGLVTLRMIPGLAAPLFGPLADRHSRRSTMEVALAFFILSSLLMVSSGMLATGVLVAAAVSFLLYGLSKALYDPTVHAFLGDTVPYRQRGRAIGLIELSWSSAWLIGVPAAGFLIERYGWLAPWAILAALGSLGLWFTHACLPHGQPTARQVEGRQGIAFLVGSWRHLLRRRGVIALLFTSLLLVIADEIPFIIYGAWLEASFGLSLSALGLASIVVGLAEASAELGTTVITDRLGKRRSVLAGLTGMAVTLVMLPGLARLGLSAALAGVVLVVFAFEFAIVSLLPLATELVPEERASLLSLNITAIALGRIVGTASGGWLWQWTGEGIALHALIGAGCALAAALFVFFGLTEIGN